MSSENKNLVSHPVNPEDVLTSDHEVLEFTMDALGSALNMADIDALTGLHGRRTMQKAYEGLQQSQHHRKGETPLSRKHSVMIGDLDHFRDLNTQLGHIGADEKLVQAARILQSSVRERDVITRLGGEEFVIMLPRAVEEDAAKVAESIRARIEEESGITISIGVADIDLSKSLEENLATADRALYRAKDNGRNQVVMASTLAQETDR